MPNGFDSSPTMQGISYSIGFQDEATEGLREIDNEFTETEESMDDMVDSFEDTADQASEQSRRFKESFEDVNNTSFEPPQARSTAALQPEEEGEDKGFLMEGANKFAEVFEGVSKNLGGFAGTLTKVTGAFAGILAIARVFAPMLELLGFYLDVVLEPFQFMFLELAFRAKPIIASLTSKMYEFTDKVLGMLVPMMKRIIPKIIAATDAVIDFVFNSVIPAIKWVTNLVSTFFAWEGSIKVLMGAAAAFVGITIGSLVIPALISVVGALWTVISTVVSLGIAFFTTFIPAVVAGIGAVLSFTLALLANPITWVIAGVVALGVVLYKLIGGWEGLKNVVSSVWGGIKSFASWTWGFFRKYLKWFSPLTYVLKIFGSSWKEIGNIVIGIWDKVKGFFKGVTSGINKVKGLIPGMGDEDGGDAFASVKEGLTEDVTGGISLSGEEGEGDFSSIQDMIPGIEGFGTGEVGTGDAEVKPVKLEQDQTITAQVPSPPKDVSIEQQKEGTVRPLKKELRRLGDRIVRAIEREEDFTYGDISDTLRKLGRFERI